MAMNLKFWRKPTTIAEVVLTDRDAQIEWMEAGGWKVDLDLHQWNGKPWRGKIVKFIKMYHAADWLISYEAYGSLDKVVDELYLNARKSLPPKEMLSA